MNFSNLLNELAGAAGGQTSRTPSANTGSLRGMTDKIPGGLAGGAVAGGIVAMLVGSKSARKTAGKAAKYGGAAVLGGLAYKAYKDWQHNNGQANGTQGQYQAAAGNGAYPLDNGSYSRTSDSRTYDSITYSYEQEALAHMNGAATPNNYQILLIKAMIASARADGHIDGEEQRRISDAIGKLQLDPQSRGELLDLFLQPIPVNEIVDPLESMEQKAEVYLASCLAIDLDHQAEYAHLSHLAKALDLPPGLEHQLRAQAMNSFSASA